MPLLMRVVLPATLPRPRGPACSAAFPPTGHEHTDSPSKVPLPTLDAPSPDSPLAARAPAPLSSDCAGFAVAVAAT